MISFFLDCCIFMSSKDVVELFESTLSPNDESANMSSWCQLEEVHSGDVNGLDSWDVPEGLNQRDVLSTVDDEWSSSSSVSSVSNFPSSSSNSDGINHFFHIGVCSNCF